MSNEKLVRGIETLLNDIADKKDTFDNFAPRLTTLLRKEENAGWDCFSVPTAIGLSNLEEWLIKEHQLDLDYLCPTKEGLQKILQGVSDAIYKPYGDSKPTWEVYEGGAYKLLIQRIRNVPMYAAVIKRDKSAVYDETGTRLQTTQDFVNKIKSQVIELYERRVNQSDVVKDIAAFIAHETKSPWKPTSLKHHDFETQSPRLFPEDQRDKPFLIEAWNAAAPSGALMGEIADAITAGTQHYYDFPLKTRFSGWLGKSGESRCIHLRFCTAPATGGCQDVLQTNMILSLDEVESSMGSREARYAAFLPDSGDRSRNEPVYLMSAKATRSLTNGRPLTAALDDIRHVAKQQGWSDVQAFGQQLLFIS